MLDIKFVRENPALVEEAVKNRGGELCLDGFLAIEKKRLFWPLITLGY